jgi:hypothetical protein
MRRSVETEAHRMLLVIWTARALCMIMSMRRVILHGVRRLLAQERLGVVAEAVLDRVKDLEVPHQQRIVVEKALNHMILTVVWLVVRRGTLEIVEVASGIKTISPSWSHLRRGLIILQPMHIIAAGGCHKPCLRSACSQKQHCGMPKILPTLRQ